MKVGIVSNDAGGANILLNYTKINKYQYSYFLKGPSNRIFRKKRKKKIIITI